jgi:putative FmdB family regulatory protein
LRYPSGAVGGPCDTGAMPIYEYRCLNGHEFEVFQSMSEDPATRCRECDAPVERLFHPVAVHFKGSGFYTTDYAKAGSKKSSTDSGGDSGGGDSDSSKSEKKSDSGSKSDGSGDKAKAKSAD